MLANPIPIPETSLEPTIPAIAMLGAQGEEIVNCAMSCEFTQPKKRTTGKAVRFQEETQVIESVSMAKEECRKLWYTTSDYERFKRENLAVVQSVREAVEFGENSWFELFQRVYLRFCRSSPNFEESQITPTVKELERFRTSFLGLEQLVLQSYLCDCARRKDALYNQVDYWQDMELLDRNSQENMLRTISQDLSRPCCQIARFKANVVALAAADSNNN